MASKAPPGLGDEDFPGFSADVCLPSLPDLSKHHSALADVLRESPGLYDALKSRQTSSGVGLARCIKVGMDNRGHRLVKTVGMVAGDEECFNTFRELIEPVLQRHLGGCGGAIGKPLRHPQATKPGLLDQRGLTMASMDVTGRYVVSTQVSTWRCLRGFRFAPAMSLPERCEIERLVSRACCRLPNRFQGAYLPLKGSQSYAPRPGGMDGLEAASLASDGLLFEAPDSTLRLCSGSGRHWPTARGVFASRDRSFSIWVNNQEHMRVLAKHNGADLQLAYRNLSDGLEALASALSAGADSTTAGREIFAVSDRLGVLTSNLANLGTAMQVSVVIRLPGLAKHPGSSSGAQTWRAWCAAQRVTVAAAEARSQEGDLFELSNADRLGLSEVHVINLIVEVVSRLVQMEQRLECGHCIDDLLGQDVKVVVPQSVDDLAHKAQASLLHGLHTGRLLDALTIARPSPPAAGAGSGGYDPMAATAEAVLDSLVFSVAQHSKASLSADANEAEEVKNADSPPFLLPEGSRPNTSASVWTIHASSEASVNGQAAQDLVATLMQEGVDAQASARESPALEKVPATGRADMAEIRSKVGSMLFQACDDGRLEAILSDVKQHSETPKAKAQPQLKPPLSNVESLRLKACDVLLQSSEDGRLQEALREMKAEAEAQNKTSAAEAAAGAAGCEDMRKRLANSLIDNLETGRLEAAVGEVFGARKTAALALVPAAPASVGRQAVPVAPAPPRKQAKPASAALALIFEAVSTRDRRIGELTARIRETEVRLVEGDEHLGKLGDTLTAAKQDLAHLELDIEWHRCALEGAEGRHIELQACLKGGQRKLMLELDAQAQKWRQHDLDAGPSIQSARSELSTATGGTLNSNSVWGTQSVTTPRPPAGTMLEPLAPRR